MKHHIHRLGALLLSMALLISVFSGLTPAASAGSVAAVDPTGYRSAEDVEYVKVGDYVCNWGARGEDCTFLSTYAQSYYTGNYAYSTMSKLAGGSQSTAPSSALYSALKNMMVSKKTYETSYNATRDLYKYTDCLKSDYAHISSFYSGKQLTGAWDSGATWNREHTWPNSKISGDGENDICMLRPTANSENSDRGNKAYGETSSTYYNPNAESAGKYDLRGDCARIMLFVYTRWGVTDKMWGASGVMESLDILLKWMEQDPVDTWEMGRNDACQSIVGCRNVFVDYPEYAFLLFNKEIPDNYTTPSSGNPDPASYTVTAVSGNPAWGSVSVNGNVITASPKTGYYLSDAKITSGTGSLKISGNTITVTPKSDCTVTVYFAKIETVTVSFALPAGVTKEPISGEAGSKAVLSAPSGTPTDTAHSYRFAGWLDRELADTTTCPGDLILAGTNYTLAEDITLYAVYSYEETTQEQGSGDYKKVLTAPADWTGEYVIVYEGSNYLFDSSLENLNVVSNYKSDSVSGQTVAAQDGDPYKITVEKVTGGYSILCANGQYMGMTASDNGIVQSASEKYANTISLNEQGGADIVSANCRFRYNKQSGQTRFRYYKAGSYANQQPVYLYRKDSSVSITHYLTLAAACEHRRVSQEHENPTCTVPGYDRVTCDECHTVLSETVIPALGHDYVDHAAQQATCTEIGWNAYRTCSRCDYTEYEEIPALGHDYVDHAAQQATCTEIGWDAYRTCSRCDYTEYEEIAALGHSYKNGFCTVCGAEDPDYPSVHDCPCDDYDDLDNTQWYHEGVDYALNNKLMNGMGERIFAPNGSLTRAMLVTILYRLENQPDVAGENNPFTDVPAGKWYTEAVIWAASEGIVNGVTETTFVPDANITREQIAAILYRYADSPEAEGSISSYPDASSVSSYAVDAMCWAVGEGIINGLEDGSLAPKSNATRAQIATILYRYLEY